MEQLEEAIDRLERALKQLEKRGVKQELPAKNMQALQIAEENRTKLEKKLEEERALRAKVLARLEISMKHVDDLLAASKAPEKIGVDNGPA